MDQVKKRRIELLSLGFERNNHQQCWISFKYDKNWYVDFYKVLEYDESQWDACIESIKQSYTKARNSIESSELYLLGKESAKKEIERTVKDSLNHYKSKLKEETNPKLSKEINKDKVRELEIIIETLNKLL